MRGSIKFQTKMLANNIYQKGLSKEIQRETGLIANDRTLNTYREVWNEFGNYAKNELGIKDLQKLNQEHVSKYLKMKLETGISNKRAQIISSALGKMETALKIVGEKFDNANPEQYNWKENRINLLKEARKDGLISIRTNYTRAYTNPVKLNESIKKYEHKLASKVQLQGGARLEPLQKGLRENIYINPKKMGYNKLGYIEEVAPGTYKQFQGIHVDKFTGESFGKILTVEKGGKPGLVSVNIDTYYEIKEYIAQNGVLRINPHAYRNDLKQAAKASGQDYNGTHGQRWSYAQNRMESLQKNGMGYEAAKQQVSWEMKHFRSEITEHYLQ